MKMKITILEDSVIESERLKNGIRKYGQQYDWDIEIDEYESGEEYFSKNSEGTTIQASARDFALKNKSPCSACEFQAKQGISILGIKLLFFSV